MPNEMQGPVLEYSNGASERGWVRRRAWAVVSIVVLVVQLGFTALPLAFLRKPDPFQGFLDRPLLSMAAAFLSGVACLFFCRRWQKAGASRGGDLVVFVAIVLLLLLAIEAMFVS